VYCKDTKRRRDSEHVSFDFLGYTFRGRTVLGRQSLFIELVSSSFAQRSDGLTGHVDLFAAG